MLYNALYTKERKFGPKVDISYVAFQPDDAKCQDYLSNKTFVVLYPSTLTYIKFCSGSILFIGQLRNITYELFFVMRIIGDKPALSLIEALPFTAIEM